MEQDPPEQLRTAIVKVELFLKINWENLLARTVEEFEVCPKGYCLYLSGTLFKNGLTGQYNMSGGCQKVRYWMMVQPL